MLVHWVDILVILSAILKYDLMNIHILQWKSNLKFNFEVACIIYIRKLADVSVFVFMKAIPGVEKIKNGYNPATWMLEVTAASQEVALGVDFTDIFKRSELYRYVHEVLISCIYY